MQKAPNNFNTFPISSEMQQSVVWDRFHYYTVNLKWRYVFLVRKWPHSIKECHCPELFSFYLILNIIYKLVNPKFWSPALTTHLRSRPTFITAYIYNQTHIYNCLLYISSRVMNRHLKFSLHKLDFISLKLNPSSLQ